MSHKRSILSGLGGLAVIVGTLSAPGCSSQKPQNPQNTSSNSMKTIDAIVETPKRITKEVILNPKTYQGQPQESLYDQMPVGDYEFGLKYDKHGVLVGAFKSRKGEESIPVTIKQYENATGQKAPQHLDF